MLEARTIPLTLDQVQRFFGAAAERSLLRPLATAYGRYTVTAEELPDVFSGHEIYSKVDCFNLTVAQRGLWPQPRSSVRRVRGLTPAHLRCSANWRWPTCANTAPG